MSVSSAQLYVPDVFVEHAVGRGVGDHETRQLFFVFLRLQGDEQIVRKMSTAARDRGMWSFQQSRECGHPVVKGMWSIKCQVGGGGWGERVVSVCVCACVHGYVHACVCVCLSLSLSVSVCVCRTIVCYSFFVCS